MIKFGNRVVYHPSDKLNVADEHSAFEVSHGEEGYKFISMVDDWKFHTRTFLVVRDSGAFYMQQYFIDEVTFEDLVEANKIDNHCAYDNETYVRPITVYGLEVRMPDEELWSN